MSDRPAFIGPQTEWVECYLCGRIISDFSRVEGLDISDPSEYYPTMVPICRDGNHRDPELVADGGWPEDGPAVRDPLSEDDGRKPCCPDFGRHEIYHRTGKRDGSGAGYWRCRPCGSTFDEPAYAEPAHTTDVDRPMLSAAGRAAIEWADDDELRTDGGSKGSGNDQCTDHQVTIPNPPSGRITRHCENCGESVTVEVFDP